MTDTSGSDEELTHLYKAANPVPPTPSDEIWPKIEAKLPGGSAQAHPRVEPMSRLPRGPVWKWAAAAGVVLAIGVGIGRSSVAAPDGDVAIRPPRTVDPLPASQPSLQAFDALTRSRIADLEPLLTMISTDGDGGRYDPQMGEWAKGQLNRTRLALDSPGASDPVVRAVLEDLELILMQVATLADVGEARASQEMSLIARAIDEQGLLDRVRAMSARGP